MFTPKDRNIYDATVGNYLFGKDDCPFCNEEFDDGQVIWKGEYWRIVHNLYPYSGDRDHLMAVPYAHKKYGHELAQQEFGELSMIYSFMKEYYQEKEYFSTVRETLGNRSIEHYHMHFIPGRLQGKFIRKMLEGQGFPVHEDLPL